MKKYKQVKHNIRHQGAPIVNGGIVRTLGLVNHRRAIVALEIDLKSKYCQVDCSFGGSDGLCGVYISANRRSLHLNDKVKRNEPTGIEFPEYKGWEVFAAGIGRYTLSVCLIKKEKV